MRTYIITGRATAESLEASIGAWTGLVHGSVDIPVFKVEADNQGEALQLAKEIIDPLETTEVHATAVEEVPTDPSDALARLNAELNALVTGAIMTPYEHYCEAEKLLVQANQLGGELGEPVRAEAQVHATLATASIPERGSR
jgi:hypothetical protein